MVYGKSGQIFLPFCHNSRVCQTDGRTDGRTDGTEFSSLDRVCIPCITIKTTTSALLITTVTFYNVPDVSYSRCSMKQHSSSKYQMLSYRTHTTLMTTQPAASSVHYTSDEGQTHKKNKCDGKQCFKCRQFVAAVYSNNRQTCVFFKLFNLVLT